MRRALILAVLVLAAAAGGALVGGRRSPAHPAPVVDDDRAAPRAAPEEVPAVIEQPLPEAPAAAAPSAPRPKAAAPDEFAEALRKGIAWYDHRGYRNAQAWLDRATPSPLSRVAETAHLYLAAVHYLVAEDDEARRHLAAIASDPAHVVEVPAHGPSYVQLRWLLVKDPIRLRFGAEARFIERRTQHYFLATDVGFNPRRADTPAFDRFAGWLERIRVEYRAIFDLRGDDDFLPHVFVFGRAEDFYAVTSALAPSALEHPGYYFPPLRTLIVDGSERGQQEIRQTIFHEAFHQFLAEHANAPPWFNEGLATYFETAEPLPGSEGARVGGLPDLGSIPRVIESARGAAARDHAPGNTLAELVHFDHGRFHGSGESLHYAEAWSFVHFLLHGFPGGDRMLRRYFDALAGGESGEAALDEAFARRWPALEEEWLAYLRKLTPPGPPGR